MANSQVAANMITREAVRLYNEVNGFVNCIEFSVVPQVDAGVALMTETLVSPQAVVAMGVAAAVIKNPGVTRRFWDPSTW